MKKKYLPLLFIAPVLFAGCVSTSYTKTISVTKDANGKVTGTVESESIMQPNESSTPVQFDYLKK